MMKYLNKIIVLVAITFGLVSCEKNENFEILPAQESFEIVAPSSGAVLVLNDENPANTALFLSWKTLSGATGPYTIEMDVEETFSSAIILGNSDKNSFSLTVGEFNEILLGAGVKVFAEMPVYFRIVGNEETTNYITVVVTTFPSSNPILTTPDSTFEIVLSDLAPDDSAISVEWTDEDFDENSSVKVTYDIEVAEAGTDFASTQSLGTTEELSLTASHATLNTAALDLGLNVEEVGELDLRVKATFETAAGESERFSEFITISVTPFETALPEMLYVVGAGATDAGWGWTSPVELTLVGKVYSGNIKLTPDDESTDDVEGNFRFFAQQDWGPVSYNYPYYETRGYTIDTDLVNANDNDNNFNFVGTAGEYLLTIDTETRVITLGAPVYGCQFEQELYLIGNATAAGWNNNGDNTPLFKDEQCGLYHFTGYFGTDQFKLIEQKGSWQPQWGMGASEGILAGNPGSQSNDPGTIMVPAEGYYSLTVDLVALTYSFVPYDASGASDYTTIGIIGDATNKADDDNDGTPDGWQTDTNMVQSTFDTHVWYINNITLEQGEIKFRAEDSWDVSWGKDGGNISVDAGTYNVWFNDLTGDYTLIKVIDL